MRVVLIQPKYVGHVLHPPLGLGYIASFLQREGHIVEIIDTNLGLSHTQTIDRIDRMKPDLIGISVMTSTFFETKRLVSEIKQRVSTPIVLGGVHVTALPEYCIQETSADFCVYGEGELTMSELISSLESNVSINRINGVVHREGNRIVVNPPRDLIKDLNSLPFPAWSLMAPKEYSIAPVLASSDDAPVAPIMTTRGCPYQCAYCASNIIWRRKLRFRSCSNVVDEIEQLINNFGVRHIHFSDDNFTFSNKHAADICNEIINRKIDITWSCPNGVRIDSLNDRLLRKMRQAGCTTLAFGIESGSQEILNNINKRLDLSVVPNIIKRTKRYNITTFGFFILGLPGDTRETIERTIRFSKNLDLDRAWFFILAPLPGSKIFDEWVQGKSLSGIRWDFLDTYKAIVQQSDITLGELESFQRRALREFYSRPKIILNLLKKVKVRNAKTLVKWAGARLTQAT